MPIATRDAKFSEENEEFLNGVFAALSDPTRRSILTHLAAGQATMSELAAPFDMSLPGVSKHVTVLERAGLVHKWKTGRVRRCRLEAAGMDTANHWLESQRKFWTAQLDSLAEFFEEDVTEP